MFFITPLGLPYNVSPEMNRNRPPGAISLSPIAGSPGLLSAIACSAVFAPDRLQQAGISRLTQSQGSLSKKGTGAEIRPLHGDFMVETEGN